MKMLGNAIIAIFLMPGMQTVFLLLLLAPVSALIEELKLKIKINLVAVCGALAAGNAFYFCAWVAGQDFMHPMAIPLGLTKHPEVVNLGALLSSVWFGAMTWRYYTDDARARKSKARAKLPSAKARSSQ